MVSVTMINLTQQNLKSFIDNFKFNQNRRNGICLDLKKKEISKSQIIILEKGIV